MSAAGTGASPPLRRVVVVGGSLAGLRACETLRREGYGGELVVVDAEAEPFYDRPPLSKQWLAGTWDDRRIALRSPETIAALGLRAMLGRRAERLELEPRRLVLDGGDPVAFDGLVLACGASARWLPSAQPGEAVLTLRTLDDARRLRARLLGAGAAKASSLDPGEAAGPGPVAAGPVAAGVVAAGVVAGGAVAADRAPAAGGRLVVVGGGFLGLEVAATARDLGAEVTVVEPLAAPLGRVLGEQVGMMVAALHERHGVQVLLGNAVSGIEVGGEPQVTLTGGEVLAADVVLVAIGARPEFSWLAGSGLELDDGVVCDETLRAAPGVFVAGDVARVRAPDGSTLRLEHWTSAAEQGVHAALGLLAGERAEPFRTVPYFWSDQFDMKLQAIGLPDPEAELAVVAGSLAEGRFVACYGRRGRLVGVVGVGMPRQLMALRPLLATPTGFSEALRAAS